MPSERAIYEVRATGVKAGDLRQNAVLLKRIKVIWVVQSHVKKFSVSRPTLADSRAWGARGLDRLHADNGQRLNQLCEHLNMTRQAVTKHLKLLEEATLVATIWRGREKLHYLNPVPIQEIADRWIGKYQRTTLRALADLKIELERKTDEL